MSFPTVRLRRMRRRQVLRDLIRETDLCVSHLVMPLFVRPGRGIRTAIDAMPGQFQLSVDSLVEECQNLHGLGIPAVLLFGCPDKKDARARSAYAQEGLVQRAVSAIKRRIPELLVITDVCLCAYTTHGHCGIVKTKNRGEGRGARGEGEVEIDNDATLAFLAKVALSHARSGAEMVAPSDMMDGNVGAIRQTLDRAGFGSIPIMAYSVKFASSFYGPFREAVHSTPLFGDRRSYQMDSANTDEAIREAREDIEQGADILMVKPAMSYLDIIWRLKQELRYPVAAFNVSGEYAMVKAAAARGWINERAAWQEQLLSMARAGADILITYWAKDAAKQLRGS